MSVLGLLTGAYRRLRSAPALNPTAARELRVDLESRHPVDEHKEHAIEAVRWLERAQDATGSGGIARGYAVAWNRYFRARGWQPAYPETTGYAIPTLLEAARVFSNPGLAERARRAADWEIEIQLDTGAVQGGVIGQNKGPAVFNTGQVMLGWLAMRETTGDGRYSEATLRAGRFLVAQLDADGLWRRGNSSFARSDSTLYNARAAWALAEAGVALNEPEFIAGARANLFAVRGRQHPNGWFPDCCLNDPARPLLHTIAYTIRGLAEGGRVLSEAALIEGATAAAGALRDRVRADGWMSGRFDATWQPTVAWSCLTGEAQMCNNWMRLFAITGTPAWLEPIPRILAFLKTTQNRLSHDLGLRGGIKGSWPFNGGYGRFEMLNWATKYFIDALLRHDSLTNSPANPLTRVHRLA